MRIMIDAGFYAGVALDYYAPLMDKDWLVYAFEPNTKLNVKETSKKFPFKVKWIKKAVWVKGGKVGFVSESRNDSSHIQEGAKSVVPCVDFSKFVAKLPEDATIVCSMDCEGAEFPVLQKMLKDGTASRISLLDIEFHHRLTNNKYTQQDASRIIESLQQLGVRVKLKVEV